MLKTKKTMRALAMLTALVMCVTLTSVVAFAEEAAPTTVAFSGDPSYDAETGAITVSGTISAADADVTILALRDTAEVTGEGLGTMEDDVLGSKIVYIDQQAFDAGEFEFTFIPVAAAGGSVITIFVGGEGVAEPESKTLEVKNAAPALAVADADLYIGEDLVIDLGEYADTENWVDAITSFTVGTEEISEISVVENDIVVSGLEVGTYEGIEILATGYTDATSAATVTVSLYDAPTVTAPAESAVWGVDDAVITVEGATAADWLDAVVATADTGAEVIVGEGTLTIAADDADAQPLVDGELDVIVSFTGAEEFEAVEDVVVTFVSPVKASFAEIAKATVDKETDLTKYTVTLPEDGTTSYGVAYEYSVEGYEGPTFDVIRTDAEQTVVVKATLTVEGYEAYEYTVQTITVKVLGDEGPSIEEEHLTVAASAAYGTEKQLVAIAAPEDFDPEAQSFVVGGVKLYYVEATNSFVGLVTAADAAGVVADIEVVDEASETIVYGKTTLEYTSEDLGPADFGVVKRIVLGKEAAPTDKQLIASDVGGGAADGQIGPADFGAIKRVVLGKDDSLAINGAE